MRLFSFSITNTLKTDTNVHPCSTSTNTATTSKTDSKPLNVNNCPQPAHISNSISKPQVKTKSTTPIGYKTLRDPPKSWNSQISKANVNKTSPDQKYSELKNVRPKFFKMRNNMPRYLGKCFCFIFFSKTMYVCTMRYSYYFFLK